MANQGEATQEMHYAWDPGSLANGVAYLCALIGYLVSVLAAPHLSLQGFVLVTLTSVGWIVLFRSIRPVNDQGGDERTRLIISLGLIAFALLGGLAIYFGMYFNWLLAVVTVA